MTTTANIMTPQLFSCRPDDDAEAASDYLRMLNIHAAPVIEESTNRPVGVISISDLTGNLKQVRVADRMSTPPVVVAANASLHEVATSIANTGLHHLVALDAGGRAAGFVSVVDVVRALLKAAPEPDSVTPQAPQVHWSGAEALSQAGLLAAPSAPGVFVLLRNGSGSAPTVVWAESVDADVRARIHELLEDPPPTVALDLDTGRIQFRAAAVAEPRARQAALRSIVRSRFER